MISTHLLSQRLPYDLASTLTAIAAATKIQSYARGRHTHCPRVHRSTATDSHCSVRTRTTFTHSPARSLSTLCRGGAKVVQHAARCVFTGREGPVCRWHDHSYAFLTTKKTYLVPRRTRPTAPHTLTSLQPPPTLFRLHSRRERACGSRWTA